MPPPQGAAACVKGGRQKRHIHSSGTGTCTSPHSSPTCPEPGEKSGPCLRRVHNLPITPTVSCLILPPVCVILTRGSRSLRGLLPPPLYSLTAKMTKYTTTLTEEHSPSPAVPTFEVLPWESPRANTCGTGGFFPISRTRDLETTIGKAPGDGIQGPSNEEQTKLASQQDNEWRSICLGH